MITFQKFNDLFNRIIFDSSKADLLEKVAKYPDRYVGLFRPTKPRAKLLQNLLQSNEIRFGDAFEEIIEQYLISEGYTILPKKLFIVENNEQRELNIDQLAKKENDIIFVEQKVRDDHDSTKKRGQIENFEKKIGAIIKEYGDKNIKGFFYFIDPSLVKNKNYYDTELSILEKDYGVPLKTSYGISLFNDLNMTKVWEEILSYLQKWKEQIPELPETNFDLEADNTFQEIKDIPPSVFRALFNNEEIKKQILPVLFPEKTTLNLLKEYFEKKEETVYKSLAQYVNDYLAKK